jgi:hypothetical protein
MAITDIHIDIHKDSSITGHAFLSFMPHTPALMEAAATAARNTDGVENVSVIDNTLKVTGAFPEGVFEKLSKQTPSYGIKVSWEFIANYVLVDVRFPMDPEALAAHLKNRTLL